MTEKEKIQEVEEILNQEDQSEIPDDEPSSKLEGNGDNNGDDSEDWVQGDRKNADGEEDYVEKDDK